MKTFLRFLHPSVIDVVLERIEIMFDDSDESFVIIPFVVSSDSAISWSDTLQDVGFSDADEGEDLVNV